MDQYPARKPFELTIAVQPEDIDQLDHVNNVVYLRWVQEAATLHWNTFASETLKAAILWVVVRHEIDYKYSARLGDTVLTRTWIGTAEKNLFERHTEIFRHRDAKLLVRARSLWCPVDSKTLRPVRVGAAVYEAWSKGGSRDVLSQ